MFIIRFAERRIDQLLDSTILDYAPFSLDPVQFESEWSFLRSLTGRKKTAAPPPPISHSNSTTNILSLVGPKSPNGPLSPSQSQSALSSGRKFSSLKQTFGSKKHPTMNLLFSDGSVGAQTPSPEVLTSFLSALHSFLVMSDVNPALITQLWSQVYYWTGCACFTSFLPSSILTASACSGEIFNRIITRKKLLCRSRAVQINLNLSELGDWIAEVGLPSGIQSHLAPVRDLLNWLQVRFQIRVCERVWLMRHRSQLKCLSSITEFPDLVATIQSMRGINPLQVCVLT